MLVVHYIKLIGPGRRDFFHWLQRLFKVRQSKKPQGDIDGGTIQTRAHG